jgi:hypothetical protein
LKGNKLKFQRGAAAKTEGEDRNNGGKNRHHDGDGTAGCRKSPAFLGLWKFEQGQVPVVGFIRDGSAETSARVTANRGSRLPVRVRTDKTHREQNCSPEDRAEGSAP